MNTITALKVNFLSYLKSKKHTKPLWSVSFYWVVLRNHFAQLYIFSQTSYSTFNWCFLKNIQLWRKWLQFELNLFIFLIQEDTCIFYRQTFWNTSLNEYRKLDRCIQIHRGLKLLINWEKFWIAIIFECF